MKASHGLRWRNSAGRLPRGQPAVFIIAAFAGATIAKANMWRTAFAAFKFAKYLYLGPFLFGYVPGFSLEGSGMDIFKAYAMILVGTWLYAYLLSGFWARQIYRYFKKPKALPA